ncbi:MAG: TetR family transcriptional regulator C-terminal domain-containing protein [Hyphomonas sp.]|nr:TetR family transcriptional regulator C-terminal domain-containing protein [Hyphomonas sp.]
MPKIVDPEERRNAIASAAVEAISRAGLDGVKLTDIARAAGVTTGAVAHYFPDKDAVLAAALETVCARLFARIDEIDGAPTVEGIALALPLDPSDLRDWRVWLAYWGRAPFSDSLREIHRQYYLDIEAALTAKLERHTDAPGEVARAIIAAVDGAGTRITLEPDAWPADRQKALMHQLLGPLFQQHGLLSD